MMEMNVTSALELLIPRERAVVVAFLAQQTEPDARETAPGTSSSEFWL
ncbi:MAG: hypothetical protein OXG69_17125 [bacterium]|nr:hypothetical protein [bacterium]